MTGLKFLLIQCCIKGTDEPTLDKDSSVALMDYDPSDLCFHAESTTMIWWISMMIMWWQKPQGIHLRWTLSRQSFSEKLLCNSIKWGRCSILEKGVGDTDRQRQSPVGVSGGILPWTILSYFQYNFFSARNGPQQWSHAFSENFFIQTKSKPHSSIYHAELSKYVKFF